MIITVHVTPRARENSIARMDEDTYRARVTAAPEKGKANQAVIRLLSDLLNIAPTHIELIRGASTRMKQFKLN